jgi:paraquat-inducible protein A
MLTRATIDRRAVWQRIAPALHEAPSDGIACVACELVAPKSHRTCPRCGARLHHRKQFAMMRSSALVAAGFLLLPVANYFPATTLWEIGRPQPHTVLAGIKLLFRSGYAPVGLLIFTTSLALPLLKLSALTWFLVSTRRASQANLRFRTKSYRLISNLGRWSNIDPFTVMIFVPMVQFRPLAHIDIGRGAPAFVAVIVLSMVAVRLFDPRLMWDTASRADPASSVENC